MGVAMPTATKLARRAAVGDQSSVRLGAIKWRHRGLDQGHHGAVNRIRKRIPRRDDALQVRVNRRQPKPSACIKLTARRIFQHFDPQPCYGLRRFSRQVQILSRRPMQSPLPEHEAELPEVRARKD